MTPNKQKPMRSLVKARESNPEVSKLELVTAPLTGGDEHI